jgi:Domain of unknown function (DUF4267)
MLSTVATVLAGLIGAGITLIGVLAMWSPRNAAGFGIPATPTDDPAVRAWLRVKAGRDITLGLVLFLLMINGDAALLGWFMLVTTVSPIVDGLSVLRSGGTRAAAFGIHFATAAAMVVIGVLLLLA